MRDLIRPRVLFTIGIVALLCVVGAGVALYLDARRDCAAEVRSREGQRTMWVWIADAFPEADFIVQLVIELNTRLPALECHGGNAVPIGD